MVKFGEKLSALKVPRFSKSYVSYDLLKSYIDQIVDFEKTGDLVNANSRTETFVMVLSEDLNVIEHTYSKTLKELSDSLKTSVEEDVDTLVAATAFAGELEGQLNAGSKDEAALKSFVEFSKKLEDLNRYCLVNNEGVRKIIKKFEVSQHARYVSPFCGKNSVKRQAAGIWLCKRTNKRIAGGAYQLATTAAVTAKATITRLRRIREEAKLDN